MQYITPLVEKVTMRNFEVFMKQSRDSPDDYKWPVTANKTISDKTAIFIQI